MTCGVELIGQTDLTLLGEKEIKKEKLILISAVKFGLKDTLNNARLEIPPFLLPNGILIE